MAEAWDGLWRGCWPRSANSCARRGREKAPLVAPRGCDGSRPFRARLGRSRPAAGLGRIAFRRGYLQPEGAQRDGRNRYCLPGEPGAVVLHDGRLPHETLLELRVTQLFRREDANGAWSTATPIR